jgi:PncC family amidohydrolase
MTPGQNLFKTEVSNRDCSKPKNKYCKMDTIEAVVGQLLRERGLTLAVAESCTGGLLSHRLTNVPGSSDYFLGGIVAYAYDVKERVLGVSHNTLYDYGAVSAETAREMALGVRRLLHADVSLAITGIAGPGGATPDKPVGLTYIALSARDTERCERFTWSGDRESNKAASAEAALRMLEEYLEERLR